MGKKGDQTRQKILDLAAELINQKGISAMSIADLMVGTNLTKGGIYRHFSSKDAIVAEVVDQYVNSLTTRIGAALDQQDQPKLRLAALIDALASVAWDPVVRGGCLLMTVAASSPEPENRQLKSKILMAFGQMRSLVSDEIALAKERRQLPDDFDGEQFASVALSAIEGAIFVSEAEQDPKHARYISKFLKQALALDQ